MFEARKKKRGLISSALEILSLIYFNTVRMARKKHGNALIALFLNILQVFIFVIVFYLMFTFLGRGMAKIPGADFLLYLMSGVFMFLVHNQALSGVMSAESAESAMMQHAPMNTAISISSAALSSLYLQILAVTIVLIIYDAGFAPVELMEPARTAAMLLVAWISGCAVGLLFMAFKPWAPNVVQTLSQFYRRANMFTSGKMFVANTMPSWMISMFDWNPLFHVIDQTRGFAFINYTPRYTSVSYPIYFSLALIAIGLLGEFYTRKYVSLSWNAKR